jgi:Flp pilus assembly protein TadG
MLRLKCWTARSSDDDGSASLEFITAGVLLLVPLVYLVLAVASIQGAALAVEGAARQAARVYVQSPSADEARDRAARAVEFALADYGLSGAQADVRVTCAPDPTVCLTRDGRVSVSVQLAAPLPLVPDVLDMRSVASVPMHARAVQTVSRFWSDEP